MKEKRICPECNETFTRFWNFKRHLIKMHPEEYGHWDIKRDEDTEHQNQFTFLYRKYNVNDFSEKPENIADYMTKKIVDVIMKDLEGIVGTDLDWKEKLLYEIQTIKNEMKMLMNEIQMIKRI